jgi:hypothetical protein
LNAHERARVPRDAGTFGILRPDVGCGKRACRARDDRGGDDGKDEQDTSAV